MERIVKERMNRNLKLDNIKALLIFTVVFGHLLELFGGQEKAWIYYMIYTFHMPAFVFVTGFFTRQNGNRIIKKVLYPYVVYQLLYLVFQRYYLYQENTIQFTTPYWLMWYLLSLFFWMLLLQIIDWEGFEKRYVFIVTILIALLAGYDNSVGYGMSLSRTIVFLPFFVLGHYYGLQARIEEKRISKFILVCSALIITVGAVFIWVNVDGMKAIWFYHSVSYMSGGYSVWVRGGLLLIALAWIVCFLSIIPNMHIKIITSIGRYSLPIFLLHGFIVKWIQTMNLFDRGQWGNILTAFVMTWVICLCLGNKWTIKLLGVTFSLK